MIHVSSLCVERCASLFHFISLPWFSVRVLCRRACASLFISFLYIVLLNTSFSDAVLCRDSLFCIILVDPFSGLSFSCKFLR
jgi:hypothetical protein